MAAEFSTLLYEVRDGVAWITLNRPDRMNAIGGSMKPDLDAAFFQHAGQDDAVRVVAVVGAGDRAFCAGADIKERADRQIGSHDYFVQQRYTHDLFRRMELFPKPTIAAVNGVAAGGGLEIALTCDIRVAADTARLGLPEAKLGMIPAAGGTQRLPRLVGTAKAKELVFTGDLVAADEALRIGLVNRVVPAGELRDAVQALALTIAGRPPLAVRMAKHAIDTGMQAGIDAGHDFERYAAAMLVTTEDRREGFRAFVEKRAPVWQGR